MKELTDAQVGDYIAQGYGWVHFMGGASGTKKDGEIVLVRGKAFFVTDETEYANLLKDVDNENI